MAFKTVVPQESPTSFTNNLYKTTLTSAFNSSTPTTVTDADSYNEHTAATIGIIVGIIGVVLAITSVIVAVLQLRLQRARTVRMYNQERGAPDHREFVCAMVN
ncbi:hypothetical protein KC343_g502 [Hortaea werneckii]|nr:hypothetical protein KC352_g13020 [Hortaea werneckii]KAI7357859.1 hypothetical protein KC320_g1483 [Hortaea werneckii]KAI7572708.1 hypothetical protein KC317_g510 [Hortaea werneckii]KAI7618018.1 hypothetical protein KC346_g5220 [Hortaea werneckii]KAI7637823.1 hypothetical protein KC343_g502 [Hortaea werneckii]